MSRQPRFEEWVNDFCGCTMIVMAATEGQRLGRKPILLQRALGCDAPHREIELVRTENVKTKTDADGNVLMVRMEP